MGTWEVQAVDEVSHWLTNLDKQSANLVAAAIDNLEAEGPTLGRPLVDRIKNSRHHNMKELRPGSAGATELRILFAFDPLRRAILLVAGDKAGDWDRWYRRNIPLADDRYDDHLSELKGQR